MSNRTLVLLCLDSAMLGLLLVLECLDLTGLTWHEWLGFALCPVVLLHVVWQWQWFSNQFRRMLAPGAYRSRVNASLNLLLLVMMAAVSISGVLVSRVGTNLLGERLGRVRIWNDVHGVLNFVVLVLVGLHLALNWDWVMAAMRRRRPRAPAVAAGAGVASGASRSWARSIGRGLTVFGVAVLAAGVIYLIAYAQASPEKRVPRQRVVASTGRPQMQNPLTPQPRGIDLPEGLQRLGYKVLVLAVVTLIGRFGLHLRV